MIIHARQPTLQSANFGFRASRRISPGCPGWALANYTLSTGRGIMFLRSKFHGDYTGLQHVGRLYLGTVERHRQWLFPTSRMVQVGPQPSRISRSKTAWGVLSYDVTHFPSWATIHELPFGKAERSGLQSGPGIMAAWQLCLISLRRRAAERPTTSS